MRLIGQIESTSALAPAESLLPAKMSVEFEEGFGSGDRVWLRGRLLSPKVVTPPADEAGWWQFLRTESTPRPKPLVQIESRISGHTLHAEVPLGADGLFEAMFTA